MCLDISYTATISQLLEYFPDLIIHPDVQFNFGPVDHHQMIGTIASYPAIYFGKDSLVPECRMMEWAVIEHFRKTEPPYAKRKHMINARSERLVKDPTSYWYRLRHRPCAAPVTGIFEHRGIKGWKKKVPYYVRIKDQPIFFVPGIYSVVELVDPGTGEILPPRWTQVMLTRRANSVMASIHNDGENPYRMPLFLTFEHIVQYLRRDLTDEALQEILDFEMPSEALAYHPVFTIRTPKERPDGLDKTQPYIWPGLPPLGEQNPDPVVKLA